jgi:hypothetical protein
MLVENRLLLPLPHRRLSEADKTMLAGQSKTLALLELHISLFVMDS